MSANDDLRTFGTDWKCVKTFYVAEDSIGHNPLDEILKKAHAYAKSQRDFDNDFRVRRRMGGYVDVMHRDKRKNRPGKTTRRQVIVTTVGEGSETMPG